SGDLFHGARQSHDQCALVLRDEWIRQKRLRRQAQCSQNERSEQEGAAETHRAAPQTMTSPPWSTDVAKAPSELKLMSAMRCVCPFNSPSSLPVGTSRT